jgi:hypothetical protein
MILLSMGQGKSYKESLKSLEADIQHANTLFVLFPHSFNHFRPRPHMNHSLSLKVSELFGPYVMQKYVKRNHIF